MEANHIENLEVDEQAVYWLRVMQDPSADQEAAFWAWLKTSPDNVRELILAGKLEQELQAFDRKRRVDIDALMAKAAAQERWRRAPRWLGGLAASAAVVALAALVVHSVDQARQTYATKQGEQRLLDLEDGSVVILNTQSKIKVSYTAQARDIYLGDGQALFRVRHDASRPFRVHAGDAVIQAIGTQFDVRVFKDRTTVAVVEGTVQLLAPDAPTGKAQALGAADARPPKVTAGEGATIEAGGAIEPVKKIDAAAAVAWSQQRLIFKGDTLSHIIAEFNRYNVTPTLRLEGDALGDRRFIGAFNAHSPGSFLDYLKQDGSVTFIQEGDEIVIRPRDSDGAGPTVP